MSQQTLPASQRQQLQQQDHDDPPLSQNGRTNITESDLLLKVDTKLIPTTPSFSSSRPPPPPPPASTGRPDSPVSRKRSENLDRYDPSLSAKDQGFLSNSQNGAFPPSKKSKTSSPPLLSPRLSQANMSEYRSTQESPLSPQTSPIIDPLFDDADTVSPPPLDIRPPAHLVRARTLEEIKTVLPPSIVRHNSSILESMAKSSETAIGNLTLGSSTSSGRTHITERAMGVITSSPSSRQGSPAVTMKSRESTPIMVEDEHHPTGINSQQYTSTSGFSQRYPYHVLEASPTPSDSTSASEEARNLTQILADTVATYCSDSDEDYIPDADTTVDEFSNRVDSSSGEEDDDDSFTEIDADNINVPDGPFIEPFSSPSDGCYSPDDYECDEVTEDQAEIIVEEARALGIGFIIGRYILGKVFSVRQLLAAFSPELNTDSDGWTEAKLMMKFTEVMVIALRRKRLTEIHTLQQVAELLQKSKRIMVLTGAGVSVSCGIPDFRSPDGIYARLQEFNLRDPQQMFDLSFFKKRPEIFYSFAREIFPSNFMPSPSHSFIKLLEDKGKLLRNYTQNIDTLEQRAGIKSVLQCHGSFATASCLRCRRQVPGDDIKEAIFNQEVAYCTVCPPPSPSDFAPKFREAYYSSGEESDSDSDGSDFNAPPPPPLMKPDIIFFNEQLKSTFHDTLDEDRDQIDLLIVMGTSLKVAPVNSIIDALPASVPQILINRTPLTHMEFDVQLLGDSDTIVAELCRMAGWELKHEKLPDGTSNVRDMDTNNNLDGSGKGGRAHWEHFEPYTYVFEGGSLEDIEYETMLARIAQQGLAGDFDMSSESDGSDADDEGFDASRHVRGARFGSADPMETNESRSTVHESLPTAMETTGVTGSHVGVAIGTTEPRSGDLAEIHLMHSEEAFASHDHSQWLRSDDEIEITDKYMEKMPRGVLESRSMSISEEPNDSSATGSGQDIETSFMLEHRSDAELRAIMEDPLLEEEQEEAKRASDDSDNETLTFHTPNGSFQAPGFLGSQTALNLEEDNDEDLAGLSQQSFHEADLFSQ
ncbi:NAD-dependent histone deacetylase sir2 [Linnemannia gamsii]|uniref:NAD-dependent histone deacetylase sir2 n=1 Tax=Linnemannia gamsii TaxID=64522 RepID=A0ABQ7JTC5_9FUNG|nr:NAD-dependent histone deacetylase sir2 [Linnemannia gamsii]